MAYDIIGDVHGQIGKLEGLLKKLGYRIKDRAWRHPDSRIALFLGDLVDRGPGQIEVITTVRNMIEAGSARSIMGNHEWNAIGSATPDGNGGYLRPRTEAKLAEHAEFLRQIGDGSDLHKECVEWFKTLPPFLEIDGIRLCHAWWNADAIDVLRANQEADGRLNDDFLMGSFARGSDGWNALEAVSKGWEIRVPKGFYFLDHNQTKRKDIRLRWWDGAAKTYRNAALVPNGCESNVPDLPLPEDVVLGMRDTVPTFVGHYWMSGLPMIQNETMAVLDFGAGKKGPLVAYRYDGETVLSSDKLVW